MCSLSRKVIQGLQSGSLDSSFGLILNDVKQIAANFSNVFFSFAKHSVNRAAHLLARELVSLSECTEWSTYPPFYIWMLWDWIWINEDLYFLKKKI